MSVQPSRVILAPVLLGLLLLAADARADDYRTWRDSTGQFSVEARLLERTDANVVLETRDGRQLTVPIARLSESDRGRLLPPPPATPGAAPATPGNGGATGLDLSADPTQLSIGATESWQFHVEPLAVEPATRAHTINLPERRSFHEKFQIAAVNPRARRALISSVYTPQGTRDPFTRLQLLDHVRGELVMEVSVPGEWNSLALDDEATRVLLCQSSREAIGEGRLAVVEIQGGQGVLGAAWQPFGDVADPSDEELIAQLERDAATFTGIDRMRYDSLKRLSSSLSRQSALNHFRPPSGKEITYGQFLAGDRIVTINTRGAIRIFRLSDQARLREFVFPGRCVATMSPDGRHLAVAGAGLAAIIDTHQPQRVAARPFSRLDHNVRIAFSPSGQRLVVSPVNRAIVLDVATGEILHEGSLHRAGANRAIAFPAEDFLLVDHTSLYDFRARTFAWIYRGGMHTDAIGSALWMEPNRPQQVFIDKLPDAAVVERLQQFVRSPEFQVIQPGFEARLDLNDVPPEHRAEVERGIKATIERRGGRVAAQSSVVVKCFVQPPVERKVTYFGTGTHTVPVIVAGVTLIVDGVERWERAWDNVPPSVERRSHAETTELLRQRGLRPNLATFANPELLPAQLQRTPDGPTVSQGFNAFGSSQLTPEGWRSES